MAFKQTRIGWRGVRHNVADSKIHAEDVEEQSARRSTHWVAIDAGKQSNHQLIPCLGAGREFLIAEGESVPVSSEQYVVNLDEYRIDRGWYYREIEDPKCKGGKRWKRTPTSIAQWGASLAPWYSQHVYGEANKNNPAAVERITKRIQEEIPKLFEQLTGRETLGLAVHYDTQHLHFHMQHTRVDGNTHKLLPNSTKAIGLVGDWSCCVMRQVDAGVISKDSKSARNAMRLVEIARERYGRDPVDLQIYRRLDAICGVEFGTVQKNPAIAREFVSYMQSGPMRELLNLIGVYCGCYREIRIMQQALKISDQMIQEMAIERGAEINLAGP